MNCFLQQINILKEVESFKDLWSKVNVTLAGNMKIAKERKFPDDAQGSDLSELVELSDKLLLTSVEALKNLLMVVRLEITDESLMEAVFALVDEDVKTELSTALESRNE